MAKFMPGNARRVVALQMLVALAVALVLLVWKGVVVAMSGLLGGAIGFIPAWVYANRMAAVSDGTPQDLLRAQYKAEFYKFAVTVVLFALTFALFRDVSALALFLTYVATLLVYWVALVLI